MAVASHAHLSSGGRLVAEVLRQRLHDAFRAGVGESLLVDRAGVELVSRVDAAHLFLVT